jgi:hypothetical protein
MASDQKQGYFGAFGGNTGKFDVNTGQFVDFVGGLKALILLLQNRP